MTDFDAPQGEWADAERVDRIDPHIEGNYLCVTERGGIYETYHSPHAGQRSSMFWTYGLRHREALAVINTDQVLSVRISVLDAGDVEVGKKAIFVVEAPRHLRESIRELLDERIVLILRKRRPY